VFVTIAGLTLGGVAAAVGLVVLAVFAAAASVLIVRLMAGIPRDLDEEYDEAEQRYEDRTTSARGRVHDRVEEHREERVERKGSA
jgi:membrane protein implicated in regulation of membrane protease activity